MKKIILFLLLWCGVSSIYATHNHAGEILYKWLGGNEYEITIVTYTNTKSQADRCELAVYFGDGDSSVFKRINGTTYLLCGAGIPDGEVVGTDIKKNIYLGKHTYPGPGTYTIWMQDPNRIDGVKNIPNSVNVVFSLQTTLTINPLLGYNSSPVLLNPPIDHACARVCFYHNPGAYDPDGDSLSYKLTTCLGLNALPIPGYTIPPTTGTFFIDVLTGDLEWCSPPIGGTINAPIIYNVAILIEEWRQFGNKRYLVGKVLRDMQISVIDNCNHLPPVIADVIDTCIEAGKTLSFSVTASDPGDNLILSATGGPLSAVPNPKAVFNAPPLGLSPRTGLFSWLTSCDHVRKQPYMVTFKASDSGPPVLVDFETVKITVVAPAPKNPVALPLGSSMQIAWDPSPCNPINNKFIGYKIYRKISPSGWMPGHCETGVPAYTGFSLIGSINVVSGFTITDTYFTDSNNGLGLVNGVTYCYRIVACFQDGAESYASVEVCNELKKDVPVITNVDVLSTGTADSIFIKWLKPFPDAQNFDTTLHPGPYIFELYQSKGYSLATPALIKTFTGTTFKNWIDSFFVAKPLFTKDTAYSYRVKFYAAGGLDTIGDSQIASSVFLSITPSDNQLALSWKYNVPWTNYKHYIYKKGPGALSYTLHDSSLTNQYVDVKLVNGATYCYYVTTVGEYSDPDFPKPLFNKSQEVCGVPVDKTPPCPPQLNIAKDCDLFNNLLTWTNPNHFCTDDVVKYIIYYTPVQGESYTLLHTINNPSDTSYTYNNTNSIAGCFLVTAIDSFNNESSATMFCVDNCPIYELPNVFTPNGDGTNDYFTPLLPYRYIKDIDIKIYNRWGQIVFETTDPDINWDGKNKDSNLLCTDGTYFYTCTVNEIRVHGITPRHLKGHITMLDVDKQPAGN